MPIKMLIFHLPFQSSSILNLLLTRSKKPIVNAIHFHAYTPVIEHQKEAFVSVPADKCSVPLTIEPA